MISPDGTEVCGVSKGRSFNVLFCEAVEEALSVLGSAKDVVYFHLENAYNLKGEELAEKPEALCFTLKRILGSGARFIEHRILCNLFLKLGLEYEVGEVEKLPSFVKLICKARDEYSRKLLR